MKIEITLRPETAEFGPALQDLLVRAEQKLYENRHKSPPTTADWSQMLGLLRGEVLELDEQLSEDQFDENALFETADITNYALLIHFILLREAEHRNNK